VQRHDHETLVAAMTRKRKRPPPMSLR
jgi:hypothetical protein